MVFGQKELDCVLFSQYDDHRKATHTMSAIFYHRDTVQTEWVFDTTRKGAAVAAFLTNAHQTITTPNLITREIVERYHHAAYLDALQTGSPRQLAESQQFGWDPQTWQSVIAQNSAMVAAVHHALQHGRAYALASGFHHARAAHGAGFCTLNGLAIAAGEALRAGARQVVIVDLDAHAGGGTYSMVNTWPNLLHYDVHTASFDSYVSREPHRRVAITESADYIPTVQVLLDTLGALVQPGDLLLYNAGMDVYEGCAIGGLHGIDEAVITQREELVDAWARSHNLAVAGCLAGGYQGSRYPEELLIQLHAASVMRFCAD